MLHVCTPLFRFKNLNDIYNSLPNENCVTWHIAYTQENEKPNFKKNKINVIFYLVDCLEKETFKKRNAIFENINDGYFCLLDDDTIFHQNMLCEYKKMLRLDYQGMLIGQQIFKDGKLRLKANLPMNCMIDTGNVLCHHSCLKKCKWPEKISKIHNRDYLFWKDVYVFYNYKFKLIHEPISYYNKLR